MLGWLALHFGIGVLGTWMARRYALHRNLIDHPGERRSHAIPTPRGGGIAIVVSLLVAACFLAWRVPQQIILIAAYLIGLVLVAGIGLLDDHRPLSPWLRLGVQVLAAAIFAFGVVATWGHLRLGLAAFAAAMVLTNVWNFMDGINGIAASQAILVAAGLGFVAGGVWTLLSTALVAASLGFLPFNFPKARIFLGDVGSGALGYTLAVLLVPALARGDVPWPLLALPFSAFLVDSAMTLWRRLLRRERWWTPHTQHAYQRWASRAGTHIPVTLGYAGWTAAAWLATGWLKRYDWNAAMGATLTWLAITMLVWTWLQYAGASGHDNLAPESKHKDKE